MLLHFLHSIFLRWHPVFSCICASYNINQFYSDFPFLTGHIIHQLIKSILELYSTWAFSKCAINILLHNPCSLFTECWSQAQTTLCSHVEAGIESQTDRIVQEGSAPLRCLILTPLPFNLLLSSVELFCSS